MYSDTIIQRSIEKIEAAESLKRGKRFRLTRFPDSLALEMIEQLDSIRDEDGQFTRDLTPIEDAFIENELMLSAVDFRYWATRYAKILSASREGGLVTFKPAGSQELLFEHIAKLEIAMWEAYDKGLPINGICVILHKARQLGASMWAQLLLAHRCLFTPGYRALTASMDDQATQSLHNRFTRIYDHLPWWMQPMMTFRTKERGMRFGRLDSVMELQDGKQTKGLGQGENWDGGHLTECASWPIPGTIEHDFFPTCAASPSLRTLLLLESTAQGKVGWWFDFTEQVRSGTAEAGSANFAYTFVPYYAIDAWEQANGIVREDSDHTGLFEKYRRNPPDKWEPNEATRAHAQLVYETSPEWMNGRRVTLDREVLYWYESTRQQYYRQGRLNSFYTNYCATPEESFQHAGNGAISNEAIARIQTNVYKYDPWPYQLMTEEDSRECASYSDLRIHRVTLASGISLYMGPMHGGEVDKDPRGVIWLWEQPTANHTYFCGSDPSGGIPGWSRALRQKDDINIDNGVVEIWRKGIPPMLCIDCKGQGWITTSENTAVECKKCEGRGRTGGRASQVAEFAAPVDAEDLARWIFALSRIFVGNCGMEECHTIVENNNTGLLTIRKLINEYGHTNLYRWRTIDGVVPKFTNSIGWSSSPSTVPILHARSKGLIERRDAEVRSKWLAKELSDAIVAEYADGEKRRFYVPPGAGRHDDRMAAAFFTFWAMFDWSEQIEDAQMYLPEANQTASLQNLAATDCTAEEQADRWNDVVERMFNDVEYGPESDDGYVYDEENLTY